MDEKKMPSLPDIKFNKNGYEIRSDVLGLAEKLCIEEFKAKLAGWEMSTERDPKTGQLVTTVGMPEFPGLEKVLETAQKMYDFVNKSNKK